MKNVNEFKANIILFTLQNDITETIYKLDRHSIKTVRLSETINCYGRKVGGYDADDYSLENSSCSIVEDLLSELSEHFTSKEVEEIRENAFSCDDIRDLEVSEEGKKLIQEWLEQNESFTEVNAYWNFFNWCPILLDDYVLKPTYPSIYEVSDEVYEDIYSELYDENGEELFEETGRQPGEQFYEAEKPFYEAKKYTYVADPYSFADLEIKKN